MNRKYRMALDDSKCEMSGEGGIASLSMLASLQKRNPRPACPRVFITAPPLRVSSQTCLAAAILHLDKANPRIRKRSGSWLDISVQPYMAGSWAHAPIAAEKGLSLAIAVRHPEPRRAVSPPFQRFLGTVRQTVFDLLLLRGRYYLVDVVGGEEWTGLFVRCACPFEVGRNFLKGLCAIRRYGKVAVRWCPEAVK
jgi:hypothetical protein